MYFERRAKRPVGALVALLAAATFVGCGEAPPDRAAVHGRVTFHGKPIDDGTIAFTPLQRLDPASAKPAGGKIVHGDYSVEAAAGPVPGQHRVEIFAYRKTGRKIPDLLGDASIPNRPLIDEVTPLLPASFNVESQLTAEIKPGDNVVNFEL